MQIGDIGTNLIVVYTKYGDTVKVITVYPCSDVLREIKKKEGKR